MTSTLLTTVLGWIALTGCTTRATDEFILRHEFGIPGSAETVIYHATPAESGWFGREGLKITMIFRLNDADVAILSRAAGSSRTWRPLPIPETVLAHLAGIRSAREARIRAAQDSGTPLPPEGSVYNPTDKELMHQFRQSMPPLPRMGWYLIKTAGTDIMHAPKTVRTTLDEDVNDFMLAVLDPEHHRVVIRVSTRY